MGVHTTITSQFRATFSSSKLNEPHKPSVNLDSSHTGQPPGQVRSPVCTEQTKTTDISVTDISTSFFDCSQWQGWLSQFSGFPSGVIFSRLDTNSSALDADFTVILTAIKLGKLNSQQRKVKFSLNLKVIWKLQFRIEEITISGLLNINKTRKFPSLNKNQLLLQTFHWKEKPT